jgi:sulfonate transport system substrate-binding protein
MLTTLRDAPTSMTAHRKRLLKRSLCARCSSAQAWGIHVRESVNRRTLLLGGGALALGGLLFGCGKRGATTGGSALLRVAVVNKGEGNSRLMLNTAGIQPQNFRVDYSTFASGQLVIEALDGGALDVGGMSEIPPVFAAASPIHSFRQIAVLHGDVNNQAVLVPGGSPIHALADLKGQRVGYVRATTSQYFLVRMLESAGLTWSDIVAIPIGVADGLAAFSNGKLDAWAIFGYPIQRAMAEGARILSTALGFLSGNYLVSAHVDALADPAKVELIHQYLRILKRGYAWAAAHRDEWAAAVAKDIGVPLTYVQDEFRRQSAVYSLRAVDAAAIASQQGVADVFARLGLIPKAVDVHPLWDDRFNSTILEAV